jgi:hypothetical protein
MTKHRKHGLSARSRRRQRSKSRPWLEIGLRRLKDAREAAAERVTLLDAKIKRQEARILEAAE